MSDIASHGGEVIECESIYASPCTCGPAVHVTLEHFKGHPAATVIMSLDDCDGLIKQIRRSMGAVRKSIQ